MEFCLIVSETNFKNVSDDWLLTDALPSLANIFILQFGKVHPFLGFA